MQRRMKALLYGAREPYRTASCGQQQPVYGCHFIHRCPPSPQHRAMLICGILQSLLAGNAVAAGTVASTSNQACGSVT